MCRWPSTLLKSIHRNQDVVGWVIYLTLWESVMVNWLFSIRSRSKMIIGLPGAWSMPVSDKYQNNIACYDLFNLLWYVPPFQSQSCPFCEYFIAVIPFIAKVVFITITVNTVTVAVTRFDYKNMRGSCNIYHYYQDIACYNIRMQSGWSYLQPKSLPHHAACVM